MTLESCKASKEERQKKKKEGRNAKKISVNINYLSNVGSPDSISVPQTMFAFCNFIRITHSNVFSRDGSKSEVPDLKSVC